MNVRVRICWLLLVVALLSTLVFSSATFGSQKITIMAMTSPETRGLRAVAEEFTKQTGIQVEFNEQGRMNYFTNVITQLIAGTTAFDLAQLNSTYVTELAAAGAIDYWDEYLKNPKMTNLDEYDLEDVPIIYRYEGKIAMIPTDAMSQLFYYRSDLIKQVPETWDEVLAEAKKWTKSLNPASPTTYGVATSALPGSEPPKLFYPILWSFGGEVFDQTGNVALNSENTIRALKFFRALKAVMPEDITSYDYTKVLDSLKNGTVAMAPVFWNAAYNDIQASNSPYKDVIKVALIPGMKDSSGKLVRKPQTHSWGLVINKRSRNKEAAWKFLLFATSKEGGKIHGKNGGSPFRTSILADPDWARGDYYTKMSATYRIAQSEPLVPYYSKLHEVMNQMLTKVLTTEEPLNNIVAQAAKDLEALAAKYGKR